MNAYELAKAQQAYSPPTLEEIIKQQADRIAELEKGLELVKDAYCARDSECRQLKDRIAELEKYIQTLAEISNKHNKSIPTSELGWQQTKPLSRSDAYALAIENGFMLSTQHGQDENKLMPVTDGDTLLKLVKAIEERHGIK